MPPHTLLVRGGFDYKNMPKGVYKRKQGIYPLIPRTERHKTKIREARLKRKEKLGYLNSPETREKIKLAMKGKKRQPMSKSTKRKIGESMMGDKNPMKEMINRKKLSDAQTGSKNHFWQGGISFEPYSTDWTKTLKKSIRQRDKYTCQICGKEPAICVHHKDYNKLNCNPDNLITLCNACHSKTNNNRNYWINYFKSNHNQ